MNVSLPQRRVRSRRPSLARTAVVTGIALATSILTVSPSHAATADAATIDKVAKQLVSDADTPKFLTPDRAKCMAKALITKVGAVRAVKITDPKYSTTDADDALIFPILGQCVPALDLGTFFADVFAQQAPGTTLSTKSKTCLGEKIIADSTIITSGDDKRAATLLRDCLNPKELVAVVGPQLKDDPYISKMTPTESECAVPKFLELGLRLESTDPKFAAEAIGTVRQCLTTDRFVAVFATQPITGLTKKSSDCVIKAVFAKLTPAELVALSKTDKNGTGLAPASKSAVTKAITACGKA